ncbi:MAG: hypothetical protein L0Y72_14875 [Gemmataceae bacterium]|nr:hypothetical protein [Gemmataceae bacterium]MCI0740326.1 hypothetical protein [Gemmataceae bacterium]
MRLCTLLACALFTATLFAPHAGAQVKEPGKKPETKAQAEVKRLTVAFREQNWDKVFEWLVDQTGLPFLSAHKAPTGTFTLVTAPGFTLTIPELIDLVNERLLASRFHVMRRDSAFLLLPADERIDPALVPTVPIEDLAKRGRTELVRVVLPLKTLKAKDLVPEVRKLLSPFGEASSLADRLVLQDAAGNVRLILKTIQDLEAQGPGRAKQAAPVPATPVLRAYAVPAGKAEAIAKLLQEIYRAEPKVRIMATRDSGILVWGSAEDHVEIARHLQGMPPAVTEVIPLASLPATRAVQTLKGMFAGAGDLYLEADTTRNAVIVRGTAEQIQEVKAALGPLCDGAAPATVRVVTLERGSALVLAHALEKLIRDMRPNPIRVIAPGQKAPPPPKVPVEGKTKDKLPVLTLSAVGNRLVASCDDPQIMALVQELTRQLTQTDGEGDFEIIRLRVADAIEVARLLEETMNDRDPKALKRVPVVADPATNSLLVRGSALDLMTVRQRRAHQQHRVALFGGRLSRRSGADSRAGFTGTRQERRQVICVGQESNLHSLQKHNRTLPLPRGVESNETSGSERSQGRSWGCIEGV